MADKKDSRAGDSFVVLHQIGAYVPGSVIHFTERHLRSAGDNGGVGVSIDRLLTIGAMREADKDEAKRTVEYGTGDAVAELAPFPSVPFDPTRADQPEPRPNTTGTSNIKDLGAAGPSET